MAVQEHGRTGTSAATGTVILLLSAIPSNFMRFLHLINAVYTPFAAKQLSKLMYIYIIIM